MKANATNLTIAKAVIERVRKLLDRKEFNRSITQFAEDILVEACDAIEQDTPPMQLPSVTWARHRLNKEDMASFLQRLAEIEHLLKAPPAKKLSA